MKIEDFPFKDLPFTFAFSILAAAGAALFGWSWIALIVLFVVGLVVGFIIDVFRSK
jgi:hypothetical protein